jgi:hypothetical protein
MSRKARIGGGSMVRFDDVLRLKGDGGVVAQGPLDPQDEELLELCAWVFQRSDDDAAATEMTTTGGHLEFPSGPPPKWKMVLGKVGNADLQPGDAFAVAVALMKIRGNQRVVWWGHPITLVSGKEAA